jgi:hypothetical protein
VRAGTFVPLSVPEFLGVFTTIVRALGLTPDRRKFLRPEPHAIYSWARRSLILRGVSSGSLGGKKMKLLI